MKKTLILFACLAIFAIAIVQIGSSAAEPPVLLQGVSGNAAAINHGDSFEVSFSIKNNNPQDDIKNITDIVINLPQLKAGDPSLSGSWDSATVGSQTFNAAGGNKITLTDIKITNNSASEIIKIKFTSQKGAKQGIYKGDITFTAKLENARVKTDTQIPPVNLAITMRETPQIAIATINQISLTQNTTNITIANAGNSILNNIKFNLTGDLNLTLSPAGDITLLDIGQSATRQVTTDLSSLKFGSRTGTITATADGGTASSISYSITKTFCKAGQKTSNLSITNAEITSFGEDEEDWRLLDEITFEADIKNSGNQDVEDVVVVLGLFDSDGNDLSDDLDFFNKDNERVELGDVAEGDTETATFTFKVPADIKLGNYKIAIKAYGEEEKEENLCVDTASDFGSSNFFMPVKIGGESDDGKQIAFSNIRFTPTSDAECGDKMFLILDVVNIGDTDQDQVKITLMNPQLGVEQYIEIKNNLNKGDTEKNIKFSFDVPLGIENKIYDMELGAEYGYKKSRGVYEDTLDSKVNVPLKVIGCGVQPVNVPLAEINVLPLDKEAKAGEEIVVTSTIKNVGNKNNTYIVGAKGHEPWATLKSATERILTLTPGETKEVKMTFTVSQSAKGEQTFTIETISGGRTDSRPVKVLLAENGAKSPFSGINLEGSTLLWVIGIVNVILLILIIILAIRLSRR